MCTLSLLRDRTIPSSSSLLWMSHVKSLMGGQNRSGMALLGSAMPRSALLLREGKAQAKRQGQKKRESRPLPGGLSRKEKCFYYSRASASLLSNPPILFCGIFPHRVGFLDCNASLRSPTNPGPLFHLSALQQQSQTCRQDPKGNVIHSGKRHVRCSNHDGNEPVTKTSHERRHYYEKQHLQSVGCDQDIVKLPVSCQDSRACVALFHTNLLAHCGGNDSRPPCKDKV
jgi:hypothetical protein